MIIIEKKGNIKNKPVDIIGLSRLKVAGIFYANLELLDSIRI